MPAVLDTHAAIWYLTDKRRLPQSVFSLIDDAAGRGAPTYISAITLIEVAYLVERGRIALDGFDRLLHALRRPRRTFELVSVDSQIAEALRRIPRDRVPDMPDRIIAATALHLGLPLATRDRRLQEIGLQIIW